MIYADYNATAPVLTEVRDAMAPWLEGEFGNPSSQHYPLGARAAKAVEQAREQLAALLNCFPDEIVFTSGGTESCFLALVGAAYAREDTVNAVKATKPTQMVLTAAEHPAVWEAAEFLRQSPFALRLSEVELNADGALEGDSLSRSITSDTLLVSVMGANNETGVIFSIEKVAALCKKIGALLHTDAVQLVGREPFDVAAHPAELISLSGHKFGAPKGVGALVVKRKTAWRSPVVGGGQEFGRRGGTLAVSQIVGLGAAAQVALRRLQETPSLGWSHVRDYFEREVCRAVPRAQIVGQECARLSNTSCVIIPGTVALDLIERLGRHGICISAGSACSASHATPSRVLLAMGFSPFDALAAIRVSFGPSSTIEDSQLIVQALSEEVDLQRESALAKLGASLLSVPQ